MDGAMSQPGTNPPNPEDAPPVIVPTARAAPPTTPMRVAAMPELSRWPRSVGIVLIVFAGLQFLGGICGALSPLFNRLAVQVTPPSMGKIDDVAVRWQGWNVGLSACSIALASMQMAAGIGMLSRRRWSIGLARGWAVAQIVLGIGQSIIQNRVMNETVSAVVSQASQGTRPMPGAVATGLAVASKFGLVFGVAWALALPVFLLIWLMRGSIRAEVATWGGTESGGGGRALPPM